MITGGSLDDSREALKLAETRGNDFIKTALILSSFSCLKLLYNDTFLPVIKMSSSAPSAAIPPAAVSLGRTESRSISPG